jgi:hypothetical protein
MPIFLKKHFQFFFLKMSLYMFVTACGFRMMVNLPILHIECAVGLTRTLWIDGSCSDPPVFLFIYSYHKFKCNDTINHIQVAVADIRDLPRQWGDTSDICFDVQWYLGICP